jgi:hypothetical protein
VNELLRMACFLLFVALGLRVLATGTDAGRRRAINLLLVYVLALSLVVTVSQVDAWPFSTYKLIQGLWGGMVTSTQVVILGVDDTGREWAIDPLSWSPAHQLVVHAWLERSYPKLATPEQREVARFLFAKAEDARQRRAGGQWIGNARWLGPLTAPDWWLYPPVPDVPPTPFAGLRAYRVEATIDGTSRRVVAQRLLLDYRP